MPLPLSLAQDLVAEYLAKVSEPADLGTIARKLKEKNYTDWPSFPRGNLLKCFISVEFDNASEGLEFFPGRVTEIRSRHCGDDGRLAPYFVVFEDGDKHWLDLDSTAEKWKYTADKGLLGKQVEVFWNEEKKWVKGIVRRVHHSRANDEGEATPYQVKYNNNVTSSRWEKSSPDRDLEWDRLLLDELEKLGPITPMEEVDDDEGYDVKAGFGYYVTPEPKKQYKPVCLEQIVNPATECLLFPFFEHGDLSNALAAKVEDRIGPFSLEAASELGRDPLPVHDVEVTIIDFGVAKECVDGALKCVDGDSFAGTCLYMSPEQSVWGGADGTWASLKRIEGVDAHAASRRSKGGSGKKGSKKRSRKKSSSSLFHERKDVDANMIAHSSDVYAFAITAYALMGWRKEVVPRKNSQSRGADTYYYDPAGKKYRSIPEVKAALAKQASAYAV
eukprot:g350.t1